MNEIDGVGADLRSEEDFLKDLHRALKAHRQWMANQQYKINFPQLDSELEVGFESVRLFRSYLKAEYEPSVHQSTFFRKTLTQQAHLAQLAVQCREQAERGELKPADFAHLLRMDLRFDELVDQLRAEVTSAMLDLDELTGLYNRNAMERDLDEEMAMAQRGVAPFCLAMLDLDRFKQVNDQYGHPVGDEVLQQLAEFLQQSLRPYDRVYRYGGEEFLVLLPETSADRAFKVLDRVRCQLERVALQTEAGDLTVTFSAGLCGYFKGARLTDLIEKADQALYHAKSQGRNQVHLASSQA